MLKHSDFDRSQHVYQSSAFAELVKDAVRFFNGTPVHALQQVESFTGTGVYALYYIGNHPLYQRYAELNRLAYNVPIYIGKAVPRGWRQARLSGTDSPQARELCNRLREHARSLQVGAGLDLADFTCRFVIFEHEATDMIGTIEAALIKLNRPLWNSVVDGFGNHDPGKGRYEQAKSDWDVLHPGRAWADKCKGQPSTMSSIQHRVTCHLQELQPCP